MDFDGYGWGFGPFARIAGTIVYGLFSLFMILVVIGLVFLLVRFLLVATKAAQIYVAKNSPARPVTPAAAPAATPPSTVPPTKPAPTTATTKPVTKPRTPKTPPPTPTV